MTDLIGFSGEFLPSMRSGWGWGVIGGNERRIGSGNLDSVYIILKRWFIFFFKKIKKEK